MAERVYGRKGAQGAQRGDLGQAYAWNARSAQDYLSGTESAEYATLLDKVKRDVFLDLSGNVFDRSNVVKADKINRELLERFQDVAARRAYGDYLSTGTNFSKPWKRKTLGGLIGAQKIQAGAAGLSELGGAFDPAGTRPYAEVHGAEKATDAIRGEYEIGSRSVDFGRAFDRQLNTLAAGTTPTDRESPAAKRAKQRGAPQSDATQMYGYWRPDAANIINAPGFKWLGQNVPGGSGNPENAYLGIGRGTAGVTMSGTGSPLMR